MDQCGGEERGDGRAEQLPVEPHPTTGVTISLLSLSARHCLPISPPDTPTFYLKLAKMVSRTIPRLAGFVYRENRVPYFQRLFQQHDGKRQWWKTGRSGALLYPYYVSLWGTALITTYAMGRMVFGKKTFFGKE